MIIKKLILFTFITGYLSSCNFYKLNNTFDFSDHQLKVLNPIYKYKDKVTFEISNSIATPIIVESTEYLFIEQYNTQYNQWNRLPYQPCKCDIPCITPGTEELGGGETFLIRWNRERVECGYSGKSPDTIKTYQRKGIYRITFVYHPIINKKKQAGKKLVYEFRLI